MIEEAMMMMGNPLYHMWKKLFSAEIGLLTRFSQVLFIITN